MLVTIEAHHPCHERVAYAASSVHHDTYPCTLLLEFMMPCSSYSLGTVKVKCWHMHLSTRASSASDMEPHQACVLKSLAHHDLTEHRKHYLSATCKFSRLTQSQLRTVTVPR